MYSVCCMQTWAHACTHTHTHTQLNLHNYIMQLFILSQVDPHAWSTIQSWNSHPSQLVSPSVLYRWVVLAVHLRPPLTLTHLVWDNGKFIVTVSIYTLHNVVQPCMQAGDGGTCSGTCSYSLHVPTVTVSSHEIRPCQFEFLFHE